MARICEICKKGPVSGHQISHSHRKTKRKWLPNLHTVKVKKDNQVVKIKICTKCLKAGKVEKIVK
ncbi:MAG: 50S ribosomal protein L28 [Actinobacteria bacterium]|nr:50S ribosomal protein L28 [Actinomycetota bacterium]